MNNSAEKGNITILLPTLNEEEAIGKVIDELKTEGYENILVIDGHSNDKTIEIAKTKNVTVQYQKGSGKSDAIKSAIEFVKTPYLLVMDCDYTYDPKDIEKFLLAIHGSNQVIGIRILNSNKISFFNRFGNYLLTKVFNLVMGSNLHDILSGMYMFETNFIKQLDFRLKGYQLELDLVSQTEEFGKVSEVPINYRDRLGETKMSPIKEGVSVLKNLLKFSKIYNPTLLFALFASMLLIPAITLLVYVSVKWMINPEDYRAGLVQIAIILMVLGSNGIAFALLSSHLRRLDRKLNSILWKTRKEF